MELASLITHYGYLVVLIGTFLEGETVLILAGFLAHQGYLTLSGVIIAAFFGTFSGDQLFYYIGRIKGIKFLNTHPAWKTKSSRATTMLYKYNTLVIIGFRFLYGFRTITPFLIGASGVGILRFLCLNIISACAWSILIAGIGYSFGKAVEIVFKNIKQYELLAMIIIVAAGLIIWLFNFYRTKQNNKKYHVRSGKQ